MRSSATVCTLILGALLLSFEPGRLAAASGERLGVVRLDTDAAGVAQSDTPQIACDGTRVCVTWCDLRDGNSDIRFNTSPDGGATWMSEDVRLDTDPAGKAGSVLPQLACDGERVYVVWQDYRGGKADIRLNVSADGGRTWLAEDVRMDTDAAGAAESTHPQIACDGARVYVVWADQRAGRADIRLNASADGGRTWRTKDQRVDTDPAGAAASVFPQIACVGTNVQVVWSDYRDGRADVYANRSEDGGETWLPRDVRLDTDAPGSADSGFAQVASDGPGICVTWCDHRNGQPDIYANASTDGGKTWLARDVRLDTDGPGAAPSMLPQICRSGARVCVIWTDHRDGQPDIRGNASADGGKTWLPDDVRLDTDPAGTAASVMPRIACEETRVHAVWCDHRNGKPDIFLTTSRDGGSTWQEKDVRLDGDPAGAADSAFPQVACGAGRAYVLWSDFRNGRADILFAVRPP